MNLDKFIIDLESSISDALAKLEANHRQFLAVVQEGNVFRGTLTDGDLRRGLLGGLGLASSIKECVNFNSVIFNFSVSKIFPKELFKESKVNAIPILENGILIDIFFEGDFDVAAQQKTRILIMAGGKGERLRPLTNQIPKPLIPINGIPVIDRIIRQFVNQGFKDIWVSVHHLSELIISHLGDGSRFGAQIQFLTEPTPLGTAGALSLLPREEVQNVLICNADLFNNVNYKDLLDSHINSGLKATVGVTNFEFTVPFGVINSNLGKLTSIIEKPTIGYEVNAGVNVIDSEVLGLIPKNVSLNVPDLYDLLREANLEIGVFNLQGMWIDIGTKESLEKARIYKEED